MIEYAERNSDAKFVFAGIDPTVQAVYDSPLTRYFVLKDADDVFEANKLWSNAYDDGLRWARYSVTEYVATANSIVAKHWEPGPLGAQGNWKTGLTPFNVAKAPNLIANIGDLLISGRDAFFRDDIGPQVPNQPWLDLYRRHLDWIELGLWDTFEGVDREDIEDLYDKILDPSGGWRSGFWWQFDS